MSRHTRVFRILLMMALLCGLPAIAQSTAADKPVPYDQLVAWTGEGKDQALARALRSRQWRAMETQSRNVLMLTAIERQQVNSLRVLLDWGLSANQELTVRMHGETGVLTPLQLLVSGRGPMPMLDLLLDKGGDPNRASEGQFPLHTALSLGRLDLARRLLDAGADAGLSTGIGKLSPLHELALGARGAAPKDVSEMVDSLVQRGALVNAQTVRGATALHLAVLGGDIALVRALLSHGADPGVADAAGEAPLQLAERKGRTEIRSLLARGGR